jgi:hypothetical protein
MKMFDSLRENQSLPEGSRNRKMENSKKELFCSLDWFCSWIWTVQRLGFGGGGCWLVFMKIMLCIICSHSSIFLVRQKFSEWVNKVPSNTLFTRSFIFTTGWLHSKKKIWDLCRLNSSRNVDIFWYCFTDSFQQLGYALTHFTHPPSLYTLPNTLKFSCTQFLSLATVLWDYREWGWRGGGAWTGREEGKAEHRAWSSLPCTVFISFVWVWQRNSPLSLQNQGPLSLRE